MRPCHADIDTQSLLSSWNWPDIKGLDTFKGKLCHTADYDETTDLQDKKVAVIGIGSSGVQVIPSILPSVKHLYCWIRSPTWITAGFAQKYAGPNGGNFEYTEEKKKYLEEHPGEYLEYCKNLESEVSEVFKNILVGSKEANNAKEVRRRGGS